MSEITAMPPPSRPDSTRPRVNTDFEQNYVTVSGYSNGVQRILQSTIDEVEVTVSMETFDRMENDPTITRAKTTIITNALADDLQFAPGATEEQVGPEEYKTYVWVMEFCERLVSGIDKPYREVLEMILGNGIRYGHGIAEIEWDWKMDAPNTKPEEKKDTKLGTSKASKALSAFLGQGRLSSFFRGWLTMDTSGTEGDNKPKTVPDESKDSGLKRPVLEGEKLRLMPKDIKVKPRGVVQFVVDDYMNVLGLIPKFNRNYKYKWGELISREKFMVLTMNKRDEDPRGKSFYRAGFNFYQLKTQIPTEILRFILEESVPKAIGTLPPQEESNPYEQEVTKDGRKLYMEDGITPKMIPSAESMFNQIKNFRSGAGAIIPNGAKLEPYKKGYTGASDADLFSKILKTIDNQLNSAILLTAGGGDNEAKEEKQQKEQLLHSLMFWVRWILGVMTLRDVCRTGVRINLGEWAVKYLPLISLGDFMRRDWVAELEAYADAYFKGLLDDTQRPEIMSNLNMPKPGISRAQQMLEMGLVTGATQDVNGNPAQQNNQRADKQSGNKQRNTGNGTPKKKDGTKNATTADDKNSRSGDSFTLVHHRKCFVSVKGSVSTRS